MWQEHWTWIGRVWRTAIVLPIWSTSFTPPELKKAYKRLFNIHSTQIILVHLPRFTGLPTLPTLPHDPNMTHSNEIYHTDGCRFCWPHGPAIFPWKWSLTRGLIWSVKESRKQQIQRRRQESPGHEIHWWWLFWSCLNLLGSKMTFGKLESSLLFCPYIYIAVKMNQ